MTTLTVANDLYQQTSETAAARGKTANEFVAEALRKALAVVGVVPTHRNGLPVMVVSGQAPAIGPDKVRQCLEEEGF